MQSGEGLHGAKEGIVMIAKRFHSYLSGGFFKKAILIIAVFSGVLNTLPAEEKIITLGGREGWNLLSRMDGVVYGKGRFGYDCVQLDTNSRTADENSDLLIDFENSQVKDTLENYTVIENSITATNSSVMGKNAGLVHGDGGLRLSGKDGSFFGTADMTGSFLIEFWLNPFIAENGEILFSWRSSRTIANYPLYQMIRSSFVSNHMQWTFTNVFDGYTDNGGEISIQSYRTIIPNKWAHHEISWNSETGLLEYRIDGRIEAVKYITSNFREYGGTVYPLQLGVTANIDICPKYSGIVDDFHISRTCLDENSVREGYDTFRKEGGRFETQPVLISNSASLNKIDAIVTEPEQTQVVFYVRSGDNFYNWTENEPEWIPVQNHQDISGVSGLYFQVAADLFSDGGGRHSPSVTELKLSFTETEIPLPPFTLTAEAGDGKVKLSWSYSVDDNAGGYYVYYGERPGEYLGREAAEGMSPVRVGNTTSCTISGLKNGKIYYFAVVAYSRIDEHIMGDFSKEVYARPLRR